MTRLLLLIAGLSLALHVAAQNVYTVTTTAPSGAGSLLAAVQAMQANGQLQRIRFTLPAQSTIVLNGPLPNLVGASVEVLGDESPGLTIDGNGHRIFRYIGGTLLIRNLSLRNGVSADTAGCLGINGSATITDLQFSNCRTDGPAASGSAGGALRIVGSLDLRRARFIGNTVTDGGLANLVTGGGAVATSGGAATLEDVEFIGNLGLRTAPSPGGLCTSDVLGGAMTMDLPAGSISSLRRVRFQSNQLRCESSSGAFTGAGGALWLIGGAGSLASVQFDTVLMSGNRADNGAGIFARSVRLSITNSAFHDNVARGAGAMLLTSAAGGSPSELQIASSTFFANGTAIGAADIALVAGSSVSQFRNVLIGPATGNSCTPGFFTAQSGATSFVAGNDCVVGLPSGDLITTEFAADQTFGLQAPAAIGGSVPMPNLSAGSIAIDNGSATLCPSRDGRNFLRPFDGDNNGSAQCDIGAVEWRPDVMFANGYE